MPNLTPLLSASFTRYPNPLGSLALFSCQSPRPARSLFLGYLLANQPSSSRNRSSPIFLVSSRISESFFSSNLNPVASQLLRRVSLLPIPSSIPYFFAQL